MDGGREPGRIGVAWVGEGHGGGDAFLDLLLTCRKLGVSFREAIGDRLKVPGAETPDLTDLVRLRAARA